MEVSVQIETSGEVNAFTLNLKGGQCNFPILYAYNVNEVCWGKICYFATCRSFSGFAVGSGFKE